MNHLDKQQDFFFFIIPFIELLQISFLLLNVAASFSFPLPSTLFLSLLFLFFLLLLLYLLRKQYRKKQLSKAYEALSRLCDTQNSYRLTAESHQRELEKLRENFSEQLSIICTCLQENRFQEAEDLTAQFSYRIAATKEYPFCPNAIINTILTDKEQLCLRRSIAFHAELNIGDCVTVNKVHLCSIFTNLLDNAIHACEELPEGKPRFIRVAALQSGDYIHINVSNSSRIRTHSRTQNSPSKEKRPVREHGYGQKILADIAKHYSGKWNATYCGGVYEAALSLLLPPAGQN